MVRVTLLVVVSLLISVLAGCLGADDQPPGLGANEAVGGFGADAVVPGEYVTEGRFSRVLTDGPYGIGAQEALYLDSDMDGVPIEIGYVLPDIAQGETVPVIVLASPYHAPLHGDPLAPLDLNLVSPRLTENFVPHGYAVAFVAVRGTADSGGCSDLFGPLETADLDQAITWLGTQDWSNGNVGMLGVSYDGSTPWIVAGTGNPHLKTIVPISGLSDVFQLEYRNGTVEQRMLGLVSVLYWAYGFGYNNPAVGRSAENTVEGFVCPAAVEGAAVSVASGVTGERDPLGFFEARNHRPAVEQNYRGSIMLVHGLQDWNVDPHHVYPWVNTLEDSGVTVKHLLGQWGHAWPDSANARDNVQRWDWAEKLLGWFDHWLKEDKAADLGPRAEVQDSSGAWRAEDTWPPRDTTPLSFYLSGDGTLTEADPASGDVLVGPDPSLATGSPMMGGLGGDALCAACAVFRSDPLDAQLRFAGMPRVHVTVTPNAPTGHVSAFLYADDGQAYERLGWTQMDIRFHAGGETAGSVTPGEPIQMRMWLEPLDVVVDAGSSLVLVLSEGTQHDRNAVTPFVPMHVNAGDDSVLTFDTFTRGPEAFFEVPTP